MELEIKVINTLTVVKIIAKKQLVRGVVLTIFAGQAEVVVADTGDTLCFALFLARMFHRSTEFWGNIRESVCVFQ